MKILFISAIDFKQKSIQVIRKTPEHYAQNGWDVDYLVARDSVKGGNYAYEQEFDPEGLRVKRTYWPLMPIRSRTAGFTRTLLNKLAGYWVILRLAWVAVRSYKRDYDVVYGYEIHGVLAGFLSRVFLLKKGGVFVSRFQGSFFEHYFTNKQYRKIALNLEGVMALLVPTDLVIMTNDGTQGDRLLDRVKKLKPGLKYLFLPNGVDQPELLLQPRDFDPWVFISVSRLVSWKRVDRAIHFIAKLNELMPGKVVLWVVGGGAEEVKLKELAQKLHAPAIFYGPKPHHEAMSLLDQSHFLVSFYDYSNVGNPLFEAMVRGKPIITLANSDTPKWVRSGETGLIFETGASLELVSEKALKLLDEHTYLSLHKRTLGWSKELVLGWEDRLRLESNKIGNFIT